MNDDGLPPWFVDFCVGGFAAFVAKTVAAPVERLKIILIELKLTGRAHFGLKYFLFVLSEEYKNQQKNSHRQKKNFGKKIRTKKIQKKNSKKTKSKKNFEKKFRKKKFEKKKQKSKKK